MVDESADKAERTDKFKWLKAIRADSRLSPADKYVLHAAAVEYVKHEKDTFYVRQIVMAKSFGVSRSTIQRAIGKARELGYLVLLADQTRRQGRGYHDADCHRLVIPSGVSGVRLTHNGRQVDAKRASEPTHLPAETSDLRVVNKGGYKGEVTTTGELCAFSAENAPINKPDVRLVDLEPEQEHGSLRSPGLDEKQVVDFDAELLCVRCQKNPAHFASDDQLCPDCMADAEDDRRREFSVRELFG
ncbi:helix-turn-helix domain-containing protein [Mycolicibacterium alvei]|uniref:Helix-turn-helix domain-containing protein n=1 Tax=Mycolicibacterium alvei TaxID=67081 RepID=A0A6N4UNG7_9MYCO|nr:helix-turn-helix domain-containing protein [Mycolicibacterium alvei]MCV7004137.1 helix-turn-helix domain-containing protein [Mycolicibacterium alvei]BBX25989.1 hypothetical protein MALV_11140 [Mycolicibacterium alvei]